ncbi:hypothetical protein LCGC14_2629890, partial [marine sediment metagenome]
MPNELEVEFGLAHLAPPGAAREEQHSLTVPHERSGAATRTAVLGFNRNFGLHLPLL